jgi:hypothetical protein
LGFPVILVLLWCTNLSSPAFKSSRIHDAPHSSLRTLTSGFGPWIAQAQWIAQIENVDMSSASPVKIQGSLERIINLSPSLPFFRINAASILAYDLPVLLQLHARERDNLVQAALDLLQKGTTLDLRNAPLYHLEMGKIHLLKRSDPEQAYHYFQLAAGNINDPE